MLDFIAKPFGVLLMFLYEFVGNYGLAIILFALIVKLILMPFQVKSKKSMMKTTRLQPKLKELEKKHGANRQKYNEEVAKLYKAEKANPMSGCLWALLPYPILIALYQAIRFPLTIMMGVAPELLAEGGSILNMLTAEGFSSTLSPTYLQISQAQFISHHFDKFAPLSESLRQIDYSFLGLDMGQVPDFKFFLSTDWGNPAIWGPSLALFLIPVFSGVLTFISTKVAEKLNPAAANPDQAAAGSMKTMTYFMPLLSVFIGFSMPAALGLYWMSSMLFSGIQDVILTKRITKKMDAEDAIRHEQERLREAELERKRIETERLKAENRTRVNPNTSKKRIQKNVKRSDEEKRQEWEKDQEGIVSSEPSGAVGARKFARGRAYNPERYENGEAESVSAADDSEIFEDGSVTEAAIEPEKTVIPEVAEHDDIYDEPEYEDEEEDIYEDADEDDEE
jgi:YidC/Oxa1 family membrane protein insertase